MPTIIDYLTWPDAPGGPIPRRRPPQGLHEIHVQELAARAEPMAPCAAPRANLRLSRAEWTEADMRLLRQAYVWLAANATGPWHWDEEVPPCGTRLDAVCVHVERATDRARFEAVTLGAFAPVPSRPDDMAYLAASRGVVPLPTEETTFSLWMAANRGYDLDGEVARTPGAFRIRFLHMGMERAFLEAFGDTRFSIEDVDGYDTYGRDGSDPGDGALGGRVQAWAEANAAVRLAPPPDGGTGFRCAVRYEGTAEMVRWQWEDLLREDADGTFLADAEPDRRDLTVPGDFLAYLAGEAESYRAPHLPPELRKFTRAVQVPPDRTATRQRSDAGRHAPEAVARGPGSVSWEPLGPLYVAPNGLAVQTAGCTDDLERIGRTLRNALSDPGSVAACARRIRKGEAHVFGVYQYGRILSAGEFHVRDEDLLMAWNRGEEDQRPDPRTTAAVKAYLAAVALGDVEIAYDLGSDAFAARDDGIRACA